MEAVSLLSLRSWPAPCERRRNHPPPRGDRLEDHRRGGRAPALADEIELTAETGAAAGNADRRQDGAADGAGTAPAHRSGWCRRRTGLDRGGRDGRRRFLGSDRAEFPARPRRPGHSPIEKAMRERNRPAQRNRSPTRDGTPRSRVQMAEAGAAITANRRAAITRIVARAGGGRDGLSRSRPCAADRRPDHTRGLCRGLCRGSRARTWPAGRTLVGPHPRGPWRDLCRQGDARRAVFHRGTEGASDLAGAGQCPGAQG